MDRRTLTFLAVGVLLTMGLVAVSGSRGLSESTKEIVAREAADLAEATSRVASATEEIESLLARKPELYEAAALDVTAPERLGAARERIQSAEAAIERARALVEKDERDTESEVLETVAPASGVAGSVEAEVTRLLGEVRLRADFEENLSSHLERMREDHRIIEATNLTPVVAEAERAMVDWPEKREDLSERLARIEGLRAEAAEAWRTVERRSEVSGAGDVEALIQASETLARAREELTHTEETLGALVEQLYTSWDKVLADMEILENGEVTFRHKYDVVKVEIEDPSSHENTTTHEEVWAPVTRATYEKFEKNLGMTVERKPAGRYDHEAESIVQPAGLAYVASPDEGSNQYGRWQSGPGGGSFWVFYGQYALMRDLFWGGGYRPIGADHWRDYDSTRRSGRTFYGRGDRGRPMYGSQGTFTSSRYAGSRYQRTGGFQNTRYKQSGGTYRGSRYAGGGRGGSRGGRSRFGGGK